ncbi:cobalbumin biosynthesis protein [Acidimicrobium ferrooxidans DSM 10331]|uniref:Adenosylcobinamide kinase n=1 Tax=Acidimicrobium ferrooxidans (strain DSM 10331 / JCM 15462 / NBRC 103882 / ICP) TaxID=525909 RepID=C7M3A3_ACIFD|nr:bifunctional adenosylcobinamide kinase/adenosylcobinamide-phosphate guanylyltransferase [Acidimicrobium ferrooxidans]ACU53497.1 cobalbumin biosynthesis protein [Acidimicrobium ferrooxidans DSM 10331]
MSVELVLGARRSGKSAWAEARAVELRIGTYLATAAAHALDAERLAAHRARRIGRFVTLEPGDPGELVELVRTVPGGLLLDGLGLWVGWQLSSDHDVSSGELVAALARRSSPTIVVSDEVGWSVHPERALAQRFVDELGALNQAVAAIAAQVTLVVAGLPLRLKGA